MLDEVEGLGGITPLVVVPGNDLYELIGKSDTGFRVEDRDTRIVDEVGGNDHVLSIAEYPGHFILRSVFHGCAYLVVACRLCKIAGKIDNRDVNGGHTHGHAGELALKRGDDLPDSSGSAGGRRDDIVGGSAAAALASLNKTIDWVTANYAVGGTLKESCEAYLRAAGLTNAEIAAIRANMLEPNTVDEPLPGDVDGDGEVTVADALSALRASVGLAELGEEAFAAADVDADGAITVSDALRILRAAAGLAAGA